MNRSIIPPKNLSERARNPVTRSIRPLSMAAVLIVTTGSALSSGAVLQQSQEHDTAHHRFRQAEEWARTFENPARDEWQKPEEVIEPLRLRGDETLVDIGSGTGYFSVRFARALPKGRVLGADIEPDMVRYLNERAVKEDLPNLTSSVVARDNPGISEPVDMVFLCNTYHHVRDRVDYFKRVREDLRPGGRLVIVDFVKGDLPVGPPDRMKLSPNDVISELSAAGYHLIRRSDRLPYQYVLVFTIPAE